MRTVVKLQKKEFRQAVLLHHSHEIEKIIIKRTDLYKNVQGLEWKENNKELVVAGKYHEVVAVKKNGDDYVVHIIADSRENELFNSFFQTDDKSQLANCIIILLGMNFISPLSIEFKEKPSACLAQRAQPYLKYLPGFSVSIEQPPRF